MQDTIRQKLEQIEMLFPPERLAKSQERWTRLWRGEAPLDRYPFLFAPCWHFGYYVAGLTPEECLHANLNEIIYRGHFHDDFIPALFTGCRQATIPSMFGAEEVVVDDDYGCRHIIESPEDIDRLPEPSLGPGTIAYEWLQMQSYMLEATEGRLPVHVTDMQGPADVCGQLWGYDEFFACAYEDPDRYDRLMTLATDAFIKFWDAQRRLCGDRFIGTHIAAWDWVPADAGASASADSLVMISPTFYQEFYQPYLQRIGETFGGLAVHSCGNFAAVIPALCATPTVKAVNAAQMSLPELHDAGVDARTLVIGWTAADALEDTFRLIHEHNLRVDMTIDGVWPMSPQGVKPVEEWTPEERVEVQRFEERVIALASECRGTVNNRT